MSDPAFTDPAAARAQAARLRAAAERVAEQNRRLEQRIDTMDYKGPAANRFRAAMSERAQRARTLARELEEAADRLMQGGAAS